MSLANFEEILCLFSTMASNGCSLFGELPAWLIEAETNNKVVSLLRLLMSITRYIVFSKF